MQQTQVQGNPTLLNPTLQPLPPHHTHNLFLSVSHHTAFLRRAHDPIAAALVSLSDYVDHVRAGGAGGCVHVGPHGNELSASHLRNATGCQLSWLVGEAAILCVRGCVCTQQLCALESMQPCIRRTQTGAREGLNGGGRASVGAGPRPEPWRGAAAHTHYTHQTSPMQLWVVCLTDFLQRCTVAGGQWRNHGGGREAVRPGGAGPGP